MAAVRSEDDAAAVPLLALPTTLVMLTVEASVWFSWHAYVMRRLSPMPGSLISVGSDSGTCTATVTAAGGGTTMEVVGDGVAGVPFEVVADPDAVVDAVMLAVGVEEVVMLAVGAPVPEDVGGAVALSVDTEDGVPTDDADLEGVDAGVPVPLSVAVMEPVLVGVSVGVMVRVMVAVMEVVLDAVAVALPVSAGVPGVVGVMLPERVPLVVLLAVEVLLGVPLEVDVGVSVSEPVEVAVPVPVAEKVGVPALVGVPLAVRVGVGVEEPVGVPVAEGEPLLVKEDDCATALPTSATASRRRNSGRLPRLPRDAICNRYNTGREGRRARAGWANDARVVSWVAYLQARGHASASSCVWESGKGYVTTRAVS